eukprot:6461416-Prorocentrum_lima.AAC.1
MAFFLFDLMLVLRAVPRDLVDPYDVARATKGNANGSPSWEDGGGAFPFPPASLYCPLKASCKVEAP